MRSTSWSRRRSRPATSRPKYHYLTRPPELEGEATARAITLAEYAGAPLYVVHVTCSQALDAVARARDRSDLIHGETCTQYLFLTQEELERPGFHGAKYVFTPPLRSQEHQDDLWRGLHKGDLSVVSTDHCPFCFEEEPHGLKFSKRQGEAEGFHKIPNGGPGIEHRIPVLFDGAVKKRGMSLNKFVELVATNPAKLFGIYPKKGTIAVGSDADIVIFDPERALDDPRRRAQQPGRLLAVRGLRGPGQGQEDLPARQPDRRWRPLARPRRHGRVPEARRERAAVVNHSGCGAPSPRDAAGRDAPGPPGRARAVVVVAVGSVRRKRGRPQSQPWAWKKPARFRISRE